MKPACYYLRAREVLIIRDWLEWLANIGEMRLCAIMIFAGAREADLNRVGSYVCAW
jgi:hypothetical protein